MQFNFSGAALLILRKMLKICAVLKLIILFNTASADQRFITLINKGRKSYKQRVDEFIFVRETALLAKNVQNARGGNLITLNFKN